VPATKKDTKTTAKNAGRETTSKVWTDEERAAMAEHAAEMKAARSRKGKPDGESDILAKIAEMPEADRIMAERFHAIVKKTAPELEPRTWYGMPAYSKDGKLICFFQAAAKFKARYATFGFEENANLDEGAMWPTSFALKKLGPAEEARIVELLTRAVS
jgi:uncharacterized protein YdhG (YjbR/CyaY superfamily)